MSLFKSSFVPTPSLAWELFQRRWYERRKRFEERGFRRQWFLLCGPAAKEAMLKPQPVRLHKLLPPADRFWADPFLWKQDGAFFVFCEEMMVGESYAHLSALRISAEGDTVLDCQTILRKNHHLSYPFIFEYEGNLLMVPEGGAGREIEVYQCEEFPAKWRKRATLMGNLHYVDATLFPHQGRWWMFVGIKRGFHALNRDLFLFSAESPLAEHWTPHPCNPVVRTICGARPAGPVFELQGKLYRPSQNNLIRYGHSLRINEITRLDEQHYQERLASELSPDWAPGIRANHHIQWCDGLMVMDTQRLVSNQQSGETQIISRPPG
jgi:hypothetical protein